MDKMMTWRLIIFLVATMHGSDAGENCPDSCVCFQVDSPGGMVVNCTRTGVQAISSVFPLTTEGLYFEENNIETLKDVTFSHLINLRNLSIAHNLLESVPQNSFHKTKIELLDLSYNSLSAVPEGIPLSLKILNLGSNKIGTLDIKTLQNLNSLEELRLNNNNIADFMCATSKETCSDCTHGFTKLRKVDLSNNMISHICAESLDHISNVKALSLAGNKLTSLEPNIFRNFNNIQFLDLRNNQLRIIAYGVFQKLGALKYLYLRGNFLKEVPRHLPMLDWLDISWNQINHISEVDSKNDLFPIEVLILSHNPLHCNCHLVWLKELMDRREYMLKYINIPAVDFVPSCQTPPELAGESWDLLADDAFLCPDEELHYKNHVDSRHGKNVVPDETSDKKEMTYIHHSVRVKLEVNEVTREFITVKWKIKGHPHRDMLFIQYYQFGEQDSTTMFSQVIATKSHLTLSNLLPDTHYVVCAIPKNSDNELEPSSADQCINVRTLPVSQWWEDWFQYMPNEESIWFHLKFFSISLSLSCVFVWIGLYIYDVISDKLTSCKQKQHNE